MAIYANTKRKSIQLVKAFYVETTTSTEAKKCAKLHISTYT